MVLRQKGQRPQDSKTARPQDLKTEGLRDLLTSGKQILISIFAIKVKIYEGNDAYGNKTNGNEGYS